VADVDAPAIEFNPSPRPTLGVEVELQILDTERYALTNGFDRLQAHFAESDEAHFKRELIQSCVEMNTVVCDDVAHAERDLTARLSALVKIAEKSGLALAGAGTHPFSHWKDQAISPVARYHKLVEDLQYVARRMGIFGLHVHVGIDGAEKVIHVNNEVVKFLPHLLALTANSPYWVGHDTGLASVRSKVFEALPPAGLPHYLKSWEDYRWLVTNMVQTESIQTIREIWWDVRPHPDFGTIEVRMCDVPSRLTEIVAVTALIQALVVKLGDDFERGTEQPLMHPSVIRQNKWRALRYGLAGSLVSWTDYSVWPTDVAIRRLMDMLSDTAERLGTLSYFDEIERMVIEGTGAARQRRIYEETRDFSAVAREVSALLRT